MNHPAASVIIPVYNAADTIKRVLAQLITLRGDQPIEIIAVDDCSTDASLALMKEFGSAVTVVESTKNSGRGTARNRGAKAASSPLYIFLDSDCIPDNQTFFQRHIEFHAQHPRSALIGYTHTPITEEDDDYIQYRFGQPVPAHPRIKALTPGNFATGNASIEARDFWELGGFSEVFHLYEDVELALRLFHSGASFYQDEGLLIVHLDKHVRLSRDMKRNYLAYQGSVHTLIQQNINNLDHLPLARQIVNNQRTWLTKVRYEYLLPSLYTIFNRFESRLPRRLKFVCYNYFIAGAAYNGYWGRRPDFFDNLKEY